MEIPIQKQGPYLIASMKTAPADGDLLRLHDKLIEQVGRSHSRGVIVDVAALDVMDSFTTRTLGELASIMRLRGAEMVIAGIQPDVAAAVARLGLSLDAIATVLGLEQGLAYLNRKARAPVRRKHGSRR